MASAMDAALTTNLPTGLVGLAMGISTLGLTYFISRGVPQIYMTWWIGASAALMIFWIGACLWLFVDRESDHPRRVWIWARIVAGMLLVGNGLLILSVWLFFPHLAYEQRLAIALLHCALIPSQIVCCPGNIIVNRTATITMFGSLIWLLMRLDGGRALAVITFLIVLTGMMLVASGFVRQRLRDAVLLRVLGDELREQLEVALRSVTAARDAKSRFIATASHDLAQPLLAARLFSDQVMQARNVAGRMKAAQGARTAFAAAEQIIVHMLDFMRLEADAVGVVPAEVKLGTLLARIEEQYGGMASARGIRLSAMPTAITLVTDASLVERALANMIGNAIAHSGGSRLLIGARRTSPDTARLWVIDNGCGIKAEDRARLFEDYYRGAETGSGGFGLGLASVKRIAALLGGNAGIATRYRAGAAFYLELPLAAPPK